MSSTDTLSPTFTYKITRTKRKTLVIYVNEGNVEVRSPLKTPQKLIDAFIQEKSPWILKNMDIQRQKQEEKLEIAQGKEVLFFGLPRIIEVIRSTRNKVEVNEHKLFIYSKDQSQTKLERLFQRWLQEQAREYLTTQSIKVARQLNAEHKLKEVVFRKTKTKWGHCCQDGTIQYNWLVMMAPKEVIDYLVAHETSHLRHMNHSTKFWETVESVCPNYKIHRSWFAEHGHRLWLKQAS